MEQLCILLVLSIGIMGCLTPYATGPGVIIYGCGYVKSKDYWRLGAIFGVIYISMLLLVGCTDSRHVELIRSPNAE
ncbi:anion permease [Escherichia coli]